MRALHFVSAPGGSAFMHELLGVVAHEVRLVLDGSGFDSVVLEEGPLRGGPDDVFVVVPHEYFRVLPEDQHPDASTQRRTIALCVEHPGTETFEWTVRTSAPLGARLDINDDSAAALSALGLGVERFHLGYSERLDRWHGDERIRDIDVLYLGTTDDRRNRFLTFATEVLDDHEVFFAVPPHEPMVRPRPDFFMGDAKLDLLARSQVLLNLHRGASHSFEWVRALEAMCNGAVVFTEHSSDLSPLVPGRHLVAGAPHRLPSLLDRALRDRSTLATMRTEVYQWLLEERRMTASARLLLEVAAALASGHPLGAAPAWARAATGRPGQAVAESWPTWSAGLVHHEARSPAADHWTSVHLTTDDGRHEITVLVHGSPGRSGTAHLSEVARSVRRSSSDPTRSPTLEGALAAAAPLTMLLLPGDRLTPRCLERWITALDDAAVDAVYSMVAGSDGRLRSSLPFEAERMTQHDHLELASLWRTDVLRTVAAGLGRQPSTHDIWRSAARRNVNARLVPRPAVRSTA